MITAVDTSVLIDFLRADPRFGRRSRDALERCASEGRLIACDIVWAELAAGVPSGEQLSRVVAALGLDFDPVDQPSAIEAGIAWKQYRKAGGPRDRVTADFLIGAHARRRAERLLTRDRGFYRRYFADLCVVDPAAA